MAKHIPLTQGQFAIVDDEDYERLNQHKWFAVLSSTARICYACRNIRGADGKQHMIQMHRQILSTHRVDHRDGNGLNNRRFNLRAATAHQNSLNNGRRCDNTSGFKGVTWLRRVSKWQVRIMFRKGQSRFLGVFAEDRKIEAARAYDLAAIQFHGEFARLNFPREDYVNG